MKFQEVLVIFCLPFVVVAIDIDCEFGFNKIKSIYSCYARNLFVSNRFDREILNINGKHSRGFTNSQVEELVVESQNVEFLPLGISVHFPSLKVLQVKSSHLKSVDTEDFRNLKELSMLIFDDNEIEVLLPKTFDNNLKLSSISIKSNKLQNVAKNVFSPLKQLTSLDLSRNLCIDANADSKIEVSNLQKQAGKNCKLPEIFEMLLRKETGLARSSEISSPCCPCVPKIVKNGTCDYFQKQKEYVCNAVIKIDNALIDSVKFNGHHEFKQTDKDVTDFVAVNQAIPRIPKNIFKQFPNLTSVSIQNSRLSELTPKTFSKLPKLEELRLPGNDLPRLGKLLFASNPALKALDFNKNKIDYVSPCAFKHCKKLKFLSLANNLLVTLPAKFVHANLQLEIVLFNDNRLINIPQETFEPIKKIKLLDLSGNVCINEVVRPIRKNFLGNLLAGIVENANSILDPFVPAYDKQIFISASINHLGNIIMKKADKSVRVLSKETGRHGNFETTIVDGAANKIVITTDHNGVFISSSIVAVGISHVRARQLDRLTIDLEVQSNFEGVKVKTIYLGNFIKGFVNANGQIIVGAIDVNGKLQPVVENAENAGNSGDLLNTVDEILKTAVGLLEATIDEHGNIEISLINVKVGNGIIQAPHDYEQFNLEVAIDSEGKLTGIVSTYFPSLKEMLEYQCSKVL